MPCLVNDKTSMRKKKNDAHQAFRHGRLVHSWEMLLKGQHDAVGNDGGEDQVLEWSDKVKENIIVHQNHNKHILKERGNTYIHEASAA